MSFKLIPPKLSRKDLLVLYDITHPTLRTWLQRAGLGYFKGRRMFLAYEVVLIFQAIGKPQLARTAAQRLKDIYAKFRGQASDEERFKEKFKRELPPQKQDQLPCSEEEQDAPSIQPTQGKAISDPIHLNDALARLRITAIKLLGAKAKKEEQRQRLRPLKVFYPRFYRLAA